TLHHTRLGLPFVQMTDPRLIERGERRRDLPPQHLRLTQQRVRRRILATCRRLPPGSTAITGWLIIAARGRLVRLRLLHLVHRREQGRLRLGGALFLLRERLLVLPVFDPSLQQCP